MNQIMPTLLVDNSNTRTKFALAAGGQLGEACVRTLATAEISCTAVKHLLRDWEYERVCICSVVPTARKTLHEAFYGTPVTWVRTELAPDLFAGYPGVETLGEDRIANVLAVADTPFLPTVVVDMGTAVTFDVVCAGPRFTGGIIAPGLRMMAEALHGCTAQLPIVDVGEAPAVTVIGETTEEAMRSGVWLAFCGMVRETLRAIAQELGTRPRAVATGGNAAAAAACIRELDCVDELLTLRGTARAAALSSRFFAGN